MIAFLANWRIIALGAAVAGIVGLWLYVGHLRTEVAVARTRAQAAESAAAMRSVETKTIEQFHHDTKIIRETVEKEADAVEAIPSDNLPADVLAAWRGGLRNVTNSAADNPGSAKPAR
jgi:hypothetical protein